MGFSGASYEVSGKGGGGVRYFQEDSKRIRRLSEVYRCLRGILGVFRESRGFQGYSRGPNVHVRRSLGGSGGIQ